MSRGLTNDVVTEVTADQLKPALLVKAEFDSGDLLLWSGIGSIVYNGDTYTGAGVLMGISSVKEVTEIEAQGATFSLSGLSTAVLSLALNEDYQGRPITCWMAFLDSSNALIADPVVMFKGRMDVMQIDDSGDAIVIGMQAENRLIDLKRTKVRRYTPEDQKQEYPNDKGLDFVAALQEYEISWGTPPK